MKNVEESNFIKHLKSFVTINPKSFNINEKSITDRIKSVNSSRRNSTGNSNLQQNQSTNQTNATSSTSNTNNKSKPTK